MNNNIISITSAIEAAVNYAGYTAQEIHGLKAGYTGGLFEIGFRSDWSCYDCYVDAVSCEVLGFNSEPYIDSDTIFAQEGGAARRFNIAASR